MTTKKPLSAKAKKRVLIAKDTLKWLAANKLFASGTYFSFPPKSIPTDNSDKDLNKDLNKVLKKTNEPCEVCAIGGMFYSMVRRYKGVKLYECNAEYTGLNLYFSYIDPDVIYHGLRKYFSAVQISLIESAFEVAVIGSAEYYRIQEAIEFAPCESRTTRLELIMENIVKNKGTFNPPKINYD
jgi:hypothetical protein